MHNVIIVSMPNEHLSIIVSKRSETILRRQNKINMSDSRVNNVQGSILIAFVRQSRLKQSQHVIPILVFYIYSHVMHCFTLFATTCSVVLLSCALEPDPSSLLSLSFQDAVVCYSCVIVIRTPPSYTKTNPTRRSKYIE